MADVSLENMPEEQRASLAALAKRLAENPDTRREFQRLVKKDNPKAVFPELEVEDAVSRVNDAVSKATEEQNQRLTNVEIAAKRRELKESLAGEYPDLTFDDIEKAMTDHTIGDHKTAARYLSNERRLSIPAAEVPGKGGPMMMPSEARQFLKNPTQIARKLAHEVVTDIVSKRRKAA